MKAPGISNKVLVITILAIIAIGFSLLYFKKTISPQVASDISPRNYEPQHGNDRIDIIQSFKEVVLSVNYDQNGKIWISGKSVDGTVWLNDINDLNEKLAKTNPKGKAIIAMVHDAKELSGNDGLLGALPPRNLDLEKKISDSLILQGFSR